MATSSSTYAFETQAYLNGASKDQLKAEIIRAYSEIKKMQILLYELPDLKLTNLKIDSTNKKIDDLARTFHGLSTLELGDSLKGLNDKLENLSTKIPESLDDSLKNINSKMDTMLEPDDTSSTSNTWAEVVKKNRTTPPSLLLQQAILDANDKPNRERNALVKLPSDKPVDRETFVNDLLEETKLKADTTEFFWLGKKDAPTALRVKTTSKEDALKVIKSILKLRNRANNPYLNITARPDYNKTELQLFQDLWAQAIELNNKNKSFDWTVRNLRLMQNPSPSAWTPKPTKSKKQVS
uniref:Uncharacterized protein n=1 Tax=Acrobeloides nanus TaxID=290746 RepID=A0A914ELH5_9BILA